MSNVPKKWLTLTSSVVALGLAFASSASAQEAAAANPYAGLSDSGQSVAAAVSAAAFSGLVRETLPSVVANKADDSLADLPSRAATADEVWKELATGLAMPPVGPSSVIGADQRVRITNTRAFPASATVHISSNGGGCTGWMINRNTVATAGHCVHRGSGGSSGFFTRSTFRITPGRNGSLAPFGVCTARELWTVNGWANSRNEEFDYGAIKLNCSVGTRTGAYGFTTAVVNGQTVLTQGYPGDKPLGTQWFASDRVRGLTSRQVFYQADTFGGQSGSPVYNVRAGCGRCAFAIHAYGQHGFPFTLHRNNNHGTRIISAVFNFLITIRNRPGP